MKKLVPLLVAVSFMLVMVPCAADAGDLVMGRNRVDTGDMVIVKNAAGSVEVTLTIDSPWEFVETHLYVDDTNPPSKSAPGRFPFKHEDLANADGIWGTADDAGPTTDVFDEMDGLPLANGLFYFAVQAKVQDSSSPIMGAGEDGIPGNEDDVLLGYEEESVWGWAGDASDIAIPPGKNWATYFTLTPLTPS